MKKNNVKRIQSMILAMAMSLTLCVPAFAAEKEYESTQSITIHFNPNECNVNAYALSDAGRGNDAQFNSADVQRFFADNNLDLDYYRKWVYNQDTNIGGYRLYDCVINANKYLEYDGLVTN